MTKLAAWKWWWWQFWCRKKRVQTALLLSYNSELLDQKQAVARKRDLIVAADRSCFHFYARDFRYSIKGTKQLNAVLLFFKKRSAIKMIDSIQVCASQSRLCLEQRENVVSSVVQLSNSSREQQCKTTKGALLIVRLLKSRSSSSAL